MIWGEGPDGRYKAVEKDPAPDGQFELTRIFGRGHPRITRLTPRKRFGKTKLRRAHACPHAREKASKFSFS